jgi:hypothetical protein
MRSELVRLWRGLLSVSPILGAEPYAMGTLSGIQRSLCPDVFGVRLGKVFPGINKMGKWRAMPPSHGTVAFAAVKVDISGKLRGRYFPI